jgi:hypothetical protein
VRKRSASRKEKGREIRKNPREKRKLLTKSQAQNRGDSGAQKSSAFAELYFFIKKKTA